MSNLGRISASLDLGGLKVEITVSVGQRAAQSLLEGPEDALQVSGGEADVEVLLLRPCLEEMPRLLLEAHPRLCASILQASLDSVRGKERAA